MARTCDGCDSRMPPFFPRTNVEGELLCNTCVSRRATAKTAAELHRLRYQAGERERRDSTDKAMDQILYLNDLTLELVDTLRQCKENAKNSPTGECELHRHGRPDWKGGSKQSTKKVAHDSGDGETLYHCPFCGAGQLTGRSDGTAECGFCGTAFTVQVQPSLSTQPQTIDGEPVMMPDMPGVPGGEPGVPEEEIDADTAETDLEGEGEDDMDDFGQDPAAPTNPFQPAKKPNPFQSNLDARFAKKATFKTASGAHLSEDDYIRHLAIRYAPDRDRVIAKVRGSRKG